MKPATVVHVVPAPFDPVDGIIGGAERYAFELAKHMAMRVPTTLVSFGRHCRDERVGQLRLRVLGPSWHVRGQRTNPISTGLLRALWAADIIHCHQQHVVATSIAAAFGRMSRKKVFATDLGGGGWDISGYVSTDRWFDGHLHISEYSRRIAGHSHNLAAHVIYGGVDTHRFLPADVPKEGGPVLFVGRLLAHKGIDYLIRGLPPGLPLRIIGRPLDSSYLEHLRRLASNRPVEFLLECDDADLVREYQRASCVVLPSVYRTFLGHETRVPELLGQTLLEAMACGKPTICTSAGSMPEVVQHGVTGLVVPPNDHEALCQAINGIVGNPALASRLGAAGRTRVLERFTWGAVVDRCCGLYGMGTAGAAIA